MSLIKPNEAIHCKTQDEWDKVCDNIGATESLRCMYRDGVYDSIEYSFGTYGTQDAEYMKSSGRYLTPASDFLVRTELFKSNQ